MGRKLTRDEKLQRFAERIVENPSTGCHEWTGHILPNGYGRYTVGIDDEIDTHRIAWVLANGPIPKGMVVRHTVCRNRACCNAQHLQVGTYKDNMIDRERDGMTARGERQGRAKLTEEQVIAIIRDPRSSTQVAADYGIHPRYVIDLRNRKSWKHVVVPQGGMPIAAD
jgi:hypothetical protein